jgi:hypothetical protein
VFFLLNTSFENTGLVQEQFAEKFPETQITHLNAVRRLTEKNSVSLCCSLYCLCVNVYWTTATGISGHFRLPELRNFRAFSSVVRQMPGYNSQGRDTARTSQIFFLFIVTYVPFSVFCVLFVCKCVLYYCHRVSTQLQLKINNIL